MEKVNKSCPQKSNTERPVKDSLKLHDAEFAKQIVDFVLVHLFWF